jgi:hypothetical protein
MSITNTITTGSTTAAALQPAVTRRLPMLLLQAMTICGDSERQKQRQSRTI